MEVKTIWDSGSCDCTKEFAHQGKGNSELATLSKLTIFFNHHS
jgi:hypothetical protein